MVHFGGEWEVHVLATKCAIYTQTTLVLMGYGRIMGRNTKLKELPGNLVQYNIDETMFIILNLSTYL